MAERVAARLLVSGRVQGVGFRAATVDQARRLGLHGHARNLADGRVEVLAVGPDGAVAALAAWLRTGPSLARVDAVERFDADADAAADAEAAGGFSQRR